MEIHSSFGLLVCTPLELQAIEKSIPEGQTLCEIDDTENSLDVSEDNTEETEF